MEFLEVKVQLNAFRQMTWAKYDLGCKSKRPGLGRRFQALCHLPAEWSWGSLLTYSI